jgi:hypothetical protein
MANEFEIKMSSETGIPYVRIPARDLWSFAEFLSFRRKSVAFSYHSSEFTVAFPSCDSSAVRALLDDWSLFMRAESVDRHLASLA